MKYYVEECRKADGFTAFPIYTLYIYLVYQDPQIHKVPRQECAPTMAK